MTAPASPSVKVPTRQLIDLVEQALEARTSFFDPSHRSTLRLFNGFTEGFPGLVVDLYGATLVLQNHAGQPEQVTEAIPAVQGLLRSRLPWLQAGLLKTRSSPDPEERKGRLLFGEGLDRKVLEGEVWYVLDRRLNQDASLYLDTRRLREWALRSLGGRSVLNTFAYTGSLGVAALAGGASRVVQVDLNRSFLNLAKTTYTLNGFPIRRADFVAADFWVQVARYKRSGERFDCVFVDPPFFSATAKGELDLNRDSARLINKVRPLINDGGMLVAVNNALYVSGREYYRVLEELCADGYLSIEELIPVPPDFTGFPGTRVGEFPVDPAPFNHPTKIAVLRVRRKDEKTA